MEYEEIESIRAALDETPDPDLAAQLLELGDHEIYDLYDSVEEYQALRLFRLLSLEQKVDLIGNMGEAEQERLIRRLPMENMRAVLEELDPDDLVTSFRP